MSALAVSCDVVHTLSTSARHRAVSPSWRPKRWDCRRAVRTAAGRLILALMSPWNAQEAGRCRVARTDGYVGRDAKREGAFLTGWQLVCVDVSDMDAIMGARFVRGDVRDEVTIQRIIQALSGREADVLLSDMAPNTGTDPGVAHIRSIELARAALGVAHSMLRSGGTFVVKVFSGPDEPQFRVDLDDSFADVRAFKPKACKKHSVEHYLVARRFVPLHLRPDQGASLLDG